MESRKIKLINKLGLHARAAAKLVKTTNAFGCEIMIEKENNSVDAKSIMSVMLLAASCGTELLFRANGDDAQDALNAIEQLISDRFGEGE